MGNRGNRQAVDDALDDMRADEQEQLDSVLDTYEDMDDSPFVRDLMPRNDRITVPEQFIDDMEDADAD